MLSKISQITSRLYKISIAPENTFTFNHFLLASEKPVWFHCGRLAWFHENLKAAKQILKNKPINYFAFSHFEADECASLNNWLEEYPNSITIVSPIGEASIKDFSVRTPQLVKDNEYLDLGDTTIKILETPHCPHNWDACMFYEPKEEILFCSDLGANPQPIEKVITNDLRLINICIEFQKEIGYLTEGKFLTKTLQRLKLLPIEFLAIQHGEMLSGKASIQQLIERFDNEFGD